MNVARGPLSVGSEGADGKAPGPAISCPVARMRSVGENGADEEQASRCWRKNRQDNTDGGNPASFTSKT